MCNEVDQIITDRLGAGEMIDLPYGKLMERLLTMKIMRGDVPPQQNNRRNRRQAAGDKQSPFYDLLLTQAEHKHNELRWVSWASFFSIE